MIAARIEAARQRRVPEQSRLPIAWLAEVPPLKSVEDVKKFGAQLAHIEPGSRRLLTA